MGASADSKAHVDVLQIRFERKSFDVYRISPFGKRLSKSTSLAIVWKTFVLLLSRAHRPCVVRS